MIDKILQFIVIGVILFFIIGGIVLATGLSDLSITHESMNDYFEWANEPAPMSNKEKAFVDSLETKHIFVQYKRPYFDRVDRESEKQIDLRIDHFGFSCETATPEKLNAFREQLISTFYHSVLSDSIRNHIASINVTVLVPDKKNGGNCRLMNFQEIRSFSVSELQEP